MRDWDDVHRLSVAGLSGRAIARELGMSRNTVRRLLRLPSPPVYSRSADSLLGPFKNRIDHLLRQDATVPATVVRQRLTELGYVGGITILRQYLATVRPYFLNSVSEVESVANAGIIEDSGERAVRGAYDNMATYGEAGMNVISTSFQIVMINRVNERLFKKSVTEMLGKKCYEEFERRTAICPHCPGVAALATGHPHRVETRGIRDDGTEYRVRLTAYPILNPSGTPVGFVETEEDITEQKRTEEFASLFHNLHSSLGASRDITGAVRRALNLAFGLEGVNFGCAYVRTSSDGEYRTIAQRGAPRGLIDTLLQEKGNPRSTPITEQSPAGCGPDTSSSGFTGAVALVPILVNDDAMARLILGSSTYLEFPAHTRAALDSLGKMTASAIASFQANQLKERSLKKIRNLLNDIPLPIWSTDHEGRIVFWNAAAERVLGWRAHEVIGTRLPLRLRDTFAAPERTDLETKATTKNMGTTLTGPNKQGVVTKLAAMTMSADAIMNDHSESITVVHSWSTEVMPETAASRVQELFR